MAEIQAADPATRRRAILLVLGATALGAFMLNWAEGRANAIGELAGKDLDAAIEQAKLLTRLVAAAISIPLIAFAAYARRVASKVRASDQFPPAQMKVVRDTPVLRGSRAQRRASVLTAFALFLLIAAVAIPIAMERVIGAIANDAAESTEAGRRPATE